MGWTMQGSNPDGGKWFLSSEEHPYQLCGPASVLVGGYRGCFLVVKVLGTEADYIPPSSSEVEIEWSLMSSSPSALMVWTERTLLPYMSLNYCNIHKPWILFTHCMCAIHMCVRKKSNYFHRNVNHLVFAMESLCFLWGKMSILNTV